MQTKHLRQFLGKLPGIVVWLAVLPVTALGQANYATPYTFTTFAGNSGKGSADGTNSTARFAHNDGVKVDSAGNLYVADTQNDTIRMVTPAGVVTTIAGLAGAPGSADGVGSTARFNMPAFLALDHTGNLYVSDFGNHTIRQLSPLGTNWVVTTIAGLAGHSGTANGMNSAARFNNPGGLQTDGSGNVFVADAGNNMIRKLTHVGTNWVATTVAGLAGVSGSTDATGIAARFNYPAGIAVDSATTLYVADNGNSTIRMITPAGVVTTIAGQVGVTGGADGTGRGAQFNTPFGLDVDSAGNVYVADSGNNTIRELTLVGSDWVVTTLAGVAGSFGSADGTNSDARFDYSLDVAVTSAGTLYVADTLNATIRQLTPVGTDWVVSTLAGFATDFIGSADGTGTAARFYSPFGLALDSADNLYAADYYNDTIRQVTPAGVVTTLAGSAGNAGSGDGSGSNASFNNPSDVAVDSAGNLYVADESNHTIRQLTPAGTNWVVATIAGVPGASGFLNGAGTAAEFYYPCGVTVDKSNHVYVADTGNAAIRKLTLVGTTWQVTTVSQNFSGPTGVAVGPDGNLFVADYYSHTIRKMTPTGAVTIVAGLSGTAGSTDGTGSSARFYYPEYLAVDSATNIFVADTYNHTIRKVTPVGGTWVVTTVAGVAGSRGYADGTGSAALLNYPTGVAVDHMGTLFVADNSNNNIRKGWLASSVPPPSLESPSLRAGQFGFGLTGLPGLAVNIESSADLSTWQLAGTVTLVGGTNYFVSPNPAAGSQFYRGHAH